MALMNTKLQCCDWTNYSYYFTTLAAMVRHSISVGEMPVADPFNIFMMEFTCEEKFQIA